MNANLDLVGGELPTQNPVTIHLETSQWEGRTVDFSQNALSLRRSIGTPSEYLKDLKPALERYNIPIATHPLSLKAIPGKYYFEKTGCYLTSVIELMLSQNSLRRQFFAEMLKISKLKGNDPLPKAGVEKQTEKEIKVAEESPLSEKELKEMEENQDLRAKLKELESEMSALQLNPSRDPKVIRSNKEKHALLKQQADSLKLKIHPEFVKPKQSESIKPKQKPQNCQSILKDPKVVELEKKEAILQALMNLIVDSSQGNVALPGEPLRQAIFQSGFNYDFNLSTLYQEHDAAEILLLLMENLLNNSFETMAIDKPIGLETSFSRPIQKEFRMELPMLDGRHSLAETLSFVYSDTASQDPRSFEIDGQKENLFYSTRTKILSMPETMGIHLLRFDGYGKKNDEVILPDDGVVDFSAYYGGEESDSCKYEIVGSVNHRGNVRETGHYTANVKIGDKYFECDDVTSSFKEITKEAFYANTNSYLILLKKIPVPVEEIVTKRSRELAAKME